MLWDLLRLLSTYFWDDHICIFMLQGHGLMSLLLLDRIHWPYLLLYLCLDVLWVLVIAMIFDMLHLSDRSLVSVTLQGTQKQERNELLFQQFGVNYKNIHPMFRQGTCLFKAQVIFCPCFWRYFWPLKCHLITCYASAKFLCFYLLYFMCLVFFSSQFEF